MRTVLNEELVTQNATRARQALTLAIGMLLVSAALSFNAQYLLPAYGIMIAGTIVLYWAGRAAGRWIGQPRADQSLAKALKKVNGGYSLFSYVLPADHIIAGPPGLFVLAVKPHEGHISCHGERWRRGLDWRHLLRLLSQESLGNPTKQAQKQAEAMRRFLSEHLPDAAVPIHPLVVFVDPDAHVEVIEPVVPVLHLRELKAHLREAKREARIPHKTLRAVLTVFDEQTD